MPSNNGGAGNSIGWVNHPNGGFSLCKCSGCYGQWYGKNIHRLIDVVESIPHGFILNGRDGSEALAICSITHLTKFVSVAKFMDRGGTTMSDTTTKNTYEISQDELTLLLLKTSGRYASMQDQAAAILQVLEEEKEKGKW